VGHHSLFHGVPDSRSCAGLAGRRFFDEMVRSGKYPLQRPLVLVSKQANEGVVKQFLDFMLSPEAQEIVARKFVPAR
jgi:ABC-type phosphate transport system substrate-binding protein